MRNPLRRRFNLYILSWRIDELHIFWNARKVRGVQECSFFHADIDKSRLHTRQYARDFSFIDVPGNTHFFLALNKEFRKSTILDEGDAAFLRARINEYFLFHREPVKLLQLLNEAGATPGGSPAPSEIHIEVHWPDIEGYSVNYS